MNVSAAEKLLSQAAREGVRLRRHLLVGAAFREVLTQEPVVVGGTAEEFHSSAPYHETDLDLCGSVSEDERRVLRALGLRKRGRHWFHDASQVAVEFPEVRIDGDETRVEHVRVGSGTIAIIGVDDLYIDRIRQATAQASESSIEFRSALAVGAAAFERIDRRYVLRRIREIAEDDPAIGKRMRRVDSRVRRLVRRSLEP